MGREAPAGISEVLFQRIAEETHSVVVVLLAPDWRIAFANRAFRDLVGADRGAVIGRTLTDLLPGLATAGTMDLLAEVCRTGQTLSNRAAPRILYPSGPQSWWDSDFHPLPDPDGSVPAVLLMVRDVTDHVLAKEVAEQAKEELAQRAQQMHLAIDAAGTYFWNWDLATGAVDWPDGLEAACGLPPGGFGRTLDAFKALVHPDDLPRLEAALARALSGEAAYEAEFRLRHADGGIRWFSSRGTVLRDAKGRAIRMIGIGLGTTERQEREDALRLSEARFRSMAAAVPSKLWETDPEGRATWSAASWRDYVGPCPPGDDWRAVVHPEDQDGAHAAWRQAVQTGGDYVRRLRVRHADGTWRWNLLRSIPVRGADGRIERWVGAATDVHDLVEADAERARRTRHLDLLARTADRLLLGATPGEALHAIFEDLAKELGAEIYFNYMVDPDEAGTLRLAHWAGLDDVTRSAYARLRFGQALCGTMAAEREPVTFSHIHLSGDSRAEGARALGGRAYAGHPLIAQGRLVGTLSFSTRSRDAFAPDETALIKTVSDLVAATMDRDRLAEDLRTSEARFRAITDAMPQMVWSARPDGHLDYYNQRWCDFTGTAPEKLSGVTAWATICHPDDQDRAWTAWQKSLTSGEPYEIEYRLRTADGSYRWALGRALPMRDAAGAITRWFGTCTDIEDVVAAREALARSREDLERLVIQRTHKLEEANTRLLDEVTAREAAQAEAAQAQKMQALGQLAGGVAHDLNNVLQAVAGGISLMARRAEDPAQVRRLAAMLRDATARGAAVIGRLLSFARRGALKATPLDPVETLSGMREILGTTLGDHIRVETKVAPGTPRLHADKGQFEAALVNLATNARDAMPEGGVLILSAAGEAVNLGEAHPARLRPGAYVRVTVADTGSGMDAATLARVAEPFFTTKPDGEGTGLGLSMAKGFAEQSGGGIAISSTPGQGTTVSLWLPQAPETGEQTSAAATPASGGDRPVRVLLVEDQPLVLEMLADDLGERGFSAIRATNGTEALALLGAGEAVDVLVTDLSMPGMDGLRLIREARRRRPGLPAILLTGFLADGSGEGLVASLGDAPFALLRKPTTPEALAAQIALLAAERQKAA